MLNNLLATLSVGDLRDGFEQIAKWATIGVIVLLIAIGTALFFAKKDTFKKYVKYAFICLFIYLLVIGIAFIAIEIAYHYSDAYAEENWLDKDMLVKLILIPLCIFSLSLIAFFIVCVIADIKKAQKKPILIVGGVILFAELIGVMICMAVYYSKKIADDGYYNSDVASVKEVLLILSAVAIMAGIILIALTDKRSLNIASFAKNIAFAGICIAMSFALSYIKIFTLPQGGSLTLASLLPIMIYAYVFGAKNGVVVCFIYGVLQSIQDPWIIHPMQFLLDYPIAFSAIGLTGILSATTHFKDKPRTAFLLGAIIAGSLRFCSHVLSGVFAFETYAIDKGMNAWAYSLAYNSFVFIDLAVVAVVGLIVFSSKYFLTELNRISNK